MPHKGWFYKIEGLSKDMKKWHNWYKFDTVKDGTIVKCLENSRSLGVFNTSRIRVQLRDGSTEYVFSFQLDKVVKGW